MPTTARVARIHEYGPPEVLRFEDIVVGEPGDDEALIRNTVIGLNFVDVYYRRGSLPVPAFPAIIGDEAAGVVEAVGKNVKNVSVGDRVVYGDIAFGAYATARLHPADRLDRIPAGVSDDQAASAFLKGLTARYLLKEVLELRPGDTVLYHAAAGGVGQIFVQWAKALGLKVIGTVSSDAKAKLARHAGCDHVIRRLRRRSARVHRGQWRGSCFRLRRGGHVPWVAGSSQAARNACAIREGVWEPGTGGPIRVGTTRALSDVAHSPSLRSGDRRSRPIRRNRDGNSQGRSEQSLSRSEEHTSELQSLAYLVCRLLLEKKKKIKKTFFILKKKKKK